MFIALIKQDVIFPIQKQTFHDLLVVFSIDKQLLF